MEQKPKRELYWRAVYNDGTFLMQYEMKNGKQIENKYPNINREKLERFDLLDYTTNKVVFALFIHEGWKLIYRRRTLKRFNANQQFPDQVIWLVGYKEDILTNSGIRSRKVINYLYEDGSVALDDERENLELYQIEY